MADLTQAAQQVAFALATESEPNPNDVNALRADVAAMASLLDRIAPDESESAEWSYREEADR